MAAAFRNPKDSLKSTWRDNKSEWGVFHYLFNLLDVLPLPSKEKVPIHPKTDKVPFVPEWQQHRYVLFHASIPLVLHQLYVYFTGRNFNLLVAFIFYSFAYKLIGINQFRQLRGLGKRYGFLDGDKHARDDVPDVGVAKVFMSLISTSTFRAMLVTMLAYRPNLAPIELNWYMLPVELGFYGIILDFWFYWYHRVMHEFDSLWQYHRTNHLTKHPNALLTLYADHEQEFFDIVGIPLMTWLTMKFMGFPMGFYEWWMCQQYVTFTELSGHSGIRIYAIPPSTLGWLLRMIGCELVIEDHDLHHRNGWKKSGNYGKQTRLWDRLFGTFMERIECAPDNIDYVNTASLPLF